MLYLILPIINIAATPSQNYPVAPLALQLVKPSELLSTFLPIHLHSYHWNLMQNICTVTPCYVWTRTALFFVKYGMRFLLASFGFNFAVWPKNPSLCDGYPVGVWVLGPVKKSAGKGRLKERSFTFKIMHFGKYEIPNVHSFSLAISFYLSVYIFISQLCVCYIGSSFIWVNSFVYWVSLQFTTSNNSIAITSAKLEFQMRNISLIAPHSTRHSSVIYRLEHLWIIN